MQRTPVSPDEATQRDQVRRFLGLLIVACLAGATVEASAALVAGSPRWLATALLLGALAAWLAAFARRDDARQRVGTVITWVAVMLIVAIVGVAVLQPFIALVTATAVLIPIAAALPYLEGRSLRQLMVFAWAGTVAAVLAGFLPDDSAAPPAVIEFVRLWALAVVIGLVFFLLYQSSERIKQSTDEFRRLVRFPSDLAETTEPAVLGELVARHLATATGFDDCVIYALNPDTSRLGSFGSHPAERALAADPATLEERPILGRVLRDQARILIDRADPAADVGERARLAANDRSVMLLLPLVTRTEPVGVAELTARGFHTVDERRLALARTLAFEAAMAIENGRLYYQLRERALHDPLTGLANRSLFYDRVEHALARLARREEAIVAVLFIDLDDFKTVNDTLGHARGDRLLVLVAERLRAAVRPADTVARLGGDEFALLLEEVASSDEVLAISGRVGRSFKPPFELAGQPVVASASIGVALSSAAGTTADELVQEADVAMYQAKRAGKGRAVLFDPGLREAPAAEVAEPESLVQTPVPGESTRRLEPSPKASDPASDAGMNGV